MLSDIFENRVRKDANGEEMDESANRYWDVVEKILVKLVPHGWNVELLNGLMGYLQCGQGGMRRKNKYVERRYMTMFLNIMHLNVDQNGPSCYLYFPANAPYGGDGLKLENRKLEMRAVDKSECVIELSICIWLHEMQSGRSDKTMHVMSLRNSKDGLGMTLFGKCTVNGVSLWMSYFESGGNKVASYCICSDTLLLYGTWNTIELVHMPQAFWKGGDVLYCTMNNVEVSTTKIPFESTMRVLATSDDNWFGNYCMASSSSCGMERDISHLPFCGSLAEIKVSYRPKDCINPNAFMLINFNASAGFEKNQKNMVEPKAENPNGIRLIYLNASFMDSLSALGGFSLLFPPIAATVVHQSCDQVHIDSDCMAKCVICNPRFAICNPLLTPTTLPKYLSWMNSVFSKALSMPTLHHFKYGMSTTLDALSSVLENLPNDFLQSQEIIKPFLGMIYLAIKNEEWKKSIFLVEIAFRFLVVLPLSDMCITFVDIVTAWLQENDFSWSAQHILDCCVYCLHMRKSTSHRVKIRLFQLMETCLQILTINGVLFQPTSLLEYLHVTQNDDGLQAVLEWLHGLIMDSETSKSFFSCSNAAHQKWVANCLQPNRCTKVRVLCLQFIQKWSVGIQTDIEFIGFLHSCLYEQENMLPTSIYETLLGLFLRRDCTNMLQEEYTPVKLSGHQTIDVHYLILMLINLANCSNTTICRKLFGIFLRIVGHTNALQQLMYANNFPLIVLYISKFLVALVNTTRIQASNDFAMEKLAVRTSAIKLLLLLVVSSGGMVVDHMLLQERIFSIVLHDKSDEIHLLFSDIVVGLLHRCMKGVSGLPKDVGELFVSMVSAASDYDLSVESSVQLFWYTTQHLLAVQDSEPLFYRTLQKFIRSYISQTELESDTIWICLHRLNECDCNYLNRMEDQSFICAECKNAVQSFGNEGPATSENESLTVLYFIDAMLRKYEKEVGLLNPAMCQCIQQLNLREDDIKHREAVRRMTIRIQNGTFSTSMLFVSMDARVVVGPALLSNDDEKDTVDTTANAQIEPDTNILDNSVNFLEFLCSCYERMDKIDPLLKISICSTSYGDTSYCTLSPKLNDRWQALRKLLTSTILRSSGPWKIGSSSDFPIQIVDSEVNLMQRLHIQQSICGINYQEKLLTDNTLFKTAATNQQSSPHDLAQSWAMKTCNRGANECANSKHSSEWEAVHSSCPELDTNIDDSSTFSEIVQVVKISKVIGCRLKIFSDSICLQTLYRIDPTTGNQLNNELRTVHEVQISDISRIALRRRLLKPTAMEIFIRSKRTSIFVIFLDPEHRQTAYNQFRNVVPGLAPYDQYDAMIKKTLHTTTSKWKAGKISNFDYLMMVNVLSGRSFQDLSQYPVLPWVMQDYSSETIDLLNPQIYRDLTKPVGALNAKRLEKLKERSLALEDDTIPSFLYGSHYSAPGNVMYYLIRIEPYTSLHVELQGGRFDHPDRLFHSVHETWDNCLHSMSDVKELTPEWFSQPLMFKNVNSLPLGSRQSGKAVENVILPPWAKNSVEYFLLMQMKAIESDIVSSTLHNWIDLIFGYQQRGVAAKEANNTFFHLTYSDEKTLHCSSPSMQKARDVQVANFGQTPNQLFLSPHPQRNAVRSHSCTSSNEYAIDLQNAESIGQVIHCWLSSSDDHSNVLRIIYDDGLRKDINIVGELRGGIGTSALVWKTGITSQKIESPFNMTTSNVPTVRTTAGVQQGFTLDDSLTLQSRSMVTEYLYGLENSLLPNKNTGGSLSWAMIDNKHHELQIFQIYEKSSISLPLQHLHCSGRIVSYGSSNAVFAIASDNGVISVWDTTTFKQKLQANDPAGSAAGSIFSNVWNSFASSESQNQPTPIAPRCIVHTGIPAMKFVQVHEAGERLVCCTTNGDQCHVYSLLSGLYMYSLCLEKKHGTIYQCYFLSNLAIGIASSTKNNIYFDTFSSVDGSLLASRTWINENSIVNDEFQVSCIDESLIYYVNSKLGTLVCFSGFDASLPLSHSHLVEFSDTPNMNLNGWILPAHEQFCLFLFGRTAERIDVVQIKPTGMDMK